MTQLELILSAVAGASTVINFAFWRADNHLYKKYTEMEGKHLNKCQQIEKLREELQIERRQHEQLKNAISHYDRYVKHTLLKPGQTLPQRIINPFIGVVRLTPETPRARVVHTATPSGPESPYMTAEYFDWLNKHNPQERRKYLYGDFDTAYKSSKREEIKPYTGRGEQIVPQHSTYQTEDGQCAPAPIAGLDNPTDTPAD